MARNKKQNQSRSAGNLIRALPWAAVAQAGIVVGKRVSDLSKRDRERLMSLLRESGGRPAALSEKERAELRKLVGKLDLKAMGGEIVGLARRRGRR